MINDITVVKSFLYAEKTNDHAEPTKKSNAKKTKKHQHGTVKTKKIDFKISTCPAPKTTSQCDKRIFCALKTVFTFFYILQTQCLE